MISEENRKKLALYPEELLENFKSCSILRLSEEDKKYLREKFHQEDVRRARDWAYLANRVVGCEGDSY